MQTYHVALSSEPSRSFFCEKAAASLDIDLGEKLSHRLSVSADLNTAWRVGLIVGASGSGKTTLARQIWGDAAFCGGVDPAVPVMDQFPEAMTYDQRAEALNSIGLSQVPCWIRPAVTLSNGQRQRAEIALALARMRGDGAPLVVDEFTSVVDRTVAKVMSHAVQRHVRRAVGGGRLALLSCHYDVIEWLNPDWVIDCNRAVYEDRRLLWRSYRRAERLDFELRELADGRSWPGFARYHYLNDRLAQGRNWCFGLFHEGRQIAFQAFSNYVPPRPGRPVALHSNRTVVHPDYVGFGLGIKLINETSAIMYARGYDIWAKFTSLPVYRAMSRQVQWELVKAGVTTPSIGSNGHRNGSVRNLVQWFSFRYLPPRAAPPAAE